MNSAEREELIAYKIGRANETIDEVEVLIKNNLLYTAVNRLYYACFYAVSALLLKKEISARKHSGIKQMFGLHFISTGLIDSESGAFYSNIFDKRQKSDYEDFICCEEEAIIAIIGPARKLISRIEEIINEQ